jgi:hypothetical protein
MFLLLIHEFNPMNLDQISPNLWALQSQSNGTTYGRLPNTGRLGRQSDPGAFYVRRRPRPLCFSSSKVDVHPRLLAGRPHQSSFHRVQLHSRALALHITINSLRLLHVTTWVSPQWGRALRGVEAFPAVVTSHQI